MKKINLFLIFSLFLLSYIRKNDSISLNNNLLNLKTVYVDSVLYYKNKNLTIQNYLLKNVVYLNKIEDTNKVIINNLDKNIKK